MFIFKKVMIRTKDFIVNLYNKIFTNPKKRGKNRSKGKALFGDDVDEKGITESMKSSSIMLEDDQISGLRMFRETPRDYYEVYRKNIFEYSEIYVREC